jgi:hypothetical protein
MLSSDQASQISQPCIARASGGGGRRCCDVARGAGPSIFDRAKSPATLLALGLQEYDNRIVPFVLPHVATVILATAASALQQRAAVRPLSSPACASRLMRAERRLIDSTTSGYVDSKVRAK